nr:DDE-type integrase/transposase/recombinase [Luteibacter rhizovicinus]
MNKDDLIGHLDRLGLSREGIEYVVRSAEAPPSRKVRSGAKKNLIGERATSLPTVLGAATELPKGRLQFESLSGEFAFLADLEYRREALLVLDQPEAVPLVITNKRNKPMRVPYTGDFLVVKPDAVLVVELKTDAEALSLLDRRPNDWTLKDGRASYTTAHTYFRHLGIEHVVVLSSDLPWLRVQNLQLLMNWRARNLAVCKNDVISIQRFLERNSPSSIDDILAGTGLPNADALLSAICDEKVHVAIDRANLCDPHSRFICRTPSEAANVAATLATVQAMSQGSTEGAELVAIHPKHVAYYGYRIAVACGRDAIPPEGKSPPCQRTVDRWKAAYALSGALGLIPKWCASGNRNPRLSVWHSDLVEKHLAVDRSSTRHPTRKRSYKDYEKKVQAACLEKTPLEKAISYGHFCRIWAARRHNVADAAGRGGPRLANALSPHGVVDKQLPLASRPFQVAHIDHCLAPTISADETRPDGQQPWLTILVDDLTSEPLAFVLRYEYPSSTVDMLVFRECVRRHGRLPEAIYSDGGSDFTGNDMAACLGAKGIHWIKRPPAQPRAGAQVERTFGTFLTRVCRGYEGYVPDVPNRRSISSSKDPKRQPRGIFDDLRRRTEQLLYRDIPRSQRQRGGPSKLDRRLEHERVYGRSGVDVEIDLGFLIATSMACKGRGQIESAGAVRVGDKRYYSPWITAKTGSIARYFPRVDPEDDAVLYLFISGRWVVAKSRLSMESRGRTDESITVEQMLHKQVGWGPDDTDQVEASSNAISQEPAESSDVVSGANEESSRTPPDEEEPSEAKDYASEWLEELE